MTEIVIGAFCVLLLALNVLDVLSTNAFLKAGTATEANPINRWAQKTFGKWWWVAKLPLLAVLAIAYYGRQQPVMVGALFLLDGFYLYTVRQNYTVGD